MRINHNISALRASNQLGINNNSLSKSIERLSSGFRINRAADDAAGMAISRRMKTQIDGLEQASRNAADGISAIQTAEGALNEVTSMLQRMRELSVQAANGTNTQEDCLSIQKEIDQLNSEIERISTSTEFNTKKLLNGSVDKQSYTNNNSINVVSVSDGVSATNYELTVTKDARQAVITGFQFANDTVPTDASGTLVINGIEVDITSGQSIDTVYQNIRNAADSSSVKAFCGDFDTATKTDAGYKEAALAKNTNLVFVSEDYGVDASIEIICDQPKLRAFLGMDEVGASKVKSTGVDAQVTLNTNSFPKTATTAVNGNEVTITGLNKFEMKIEITPGTSGSTFNDTTATGGTLSRTIGTSSGPVAITVLSAGPIDLQIGANEGQTVEVVIPRMDPTTLGTDTLNVMTKEGAQKAILVIDDAISMATSVRSKLGAYQNRLEHAITNLDVSSENITYALSRIEDTDMAAEMTKYTQLNVLAQAGTSVLSQANERPQTILSLLQS